MKALVITLAATMSLCGSSVLADTTTTETTTTTVETNAAPSYMLPAGVTYSVVNPSSGTIVSNYSVGQSLTPGYYVVEQTSGRAYATVGSNGTLVAITTIPGTLPRRFCVVNGQLVYLSNDYSFRRAELENQIANDYDAKRLTERQVKELRDSLAYVASLENKRKSDLTYSKSTMREIERKFSLVQTALSRDIAETNNKKARIGLKVD